LKSSFEIAFKMSEETTSVGMTVGARNLDLVADLQQQPLRVAAIGSAGGRPLRDEVRDVPLRHGGGVHQDPPGSNLEICIQTSAPPSLASGVAERNAVCEVSVAKSQPETFA
jgi:hypothetical protein